MRAENDVVNFALARSEFSVGRQGAGDIRRVSAVFSADVNYHHIAIHNLIGQRAVVQHRGIQSGADNRRIGFAFASAHFVDFFHVCRNLIFVQAGPHIAHRGEVSVDRKIDSLLQQRDFAWRLYLAHGVNRGCRVFYIGRRHCGMHERERVGKMRISIFNFWRKNGVNRFVGFRQRFQIRFQLGVGTNGFESGLLRNARIVRAHFRAIPFFQA